jgi:hypothetical protein
MTPRFADLGVRLVSLVLWRISCSVQWYFVWFISGISICGLEFRNFWIKRSVVWVSLLSVRWSRSIWVASLAPNKSYILLTYASISSLFGPTFLFSFLLKSPVLGSCASLFYVLPSSFNTCKSPPPQIRASRSEFELAEVMHFCISSGWAVSAPSRSYSVSVAYWLLNSHISNNVQLNFVLHPSYICCGKFCTLCSPGAVRSTTVE